MTTNRSLLLLLSSFLALPARAAAAPPALPPLPTWSQQSAVREGWLLRRHELLLPMLRRHQLDWWIVVNEEFHDDPLTQFVAPPRPYAGNRDIFVFIDQGERGLRKVAITGFSEEYLTRFFESPAEPRPADKVLPELYAAHPPRRIGLAIAGRRGVTRSLTWDAYQFLGKALGPEASARFVSAEALIEDYLDTRLPEENPYYEKLVQMTEALTQRALSNEVIVPGRTTVGEVRTFLYDALWAAGVRTWFQPDLRLQRPAGRTRPRAGSWRSSRRRP